MRHNLRAALRVTTAASRETAPRGRDFEPRCRKMRHLGGALFFENSCDRNTATWRPRGVL